MRLLQLVFAAVAFALAPATVARASPVRFDLPAQPAATALAAFAKQAGVEVLFSSDDLKNVKTAAVVGLFEPEEALRRMLRSTGFAPTRNTTGKWVIVRESRSIGLGEIRGTILAQADGTPVAGALVHVAGTGAITRTRSDGTFWLRAVPAETAAVLVQAEGFTTLRIADVAVAAGQRVELGPVKLSAAPDGPQQLAEVVVNADDLGLSSLPLLYSLQAMIVTPSRFGIEEERGALAATLTENDLLALPQLGEDLYRAISHLPGLAADDLTARFWVRGAPHDQVLARLDGVELIEPFHMKDTDSSLSILDLETISTLNLYTGGFAAEYGNRSAGVLTMETDSYTRARPRTTLGLSLTGARIASRGQTTNGRNRWLLSARSGYPDVAIDATGNGGAGEMRPRYYDVMAKWETNLSPDQQLSFHVLHAADRMYFQDSDGPILTSRYESDYGWARWRGSFGRLTGEGALSVARLTWQRDGIGQLGKQLNVDLHEHRELDTAALRSDWTLTWSERALVRAGFEAKAERADYRYVGSRDYYVLRNGVWRIERRGQQADAAPDGVSAGVYLATRFQPVPPLTLEPGLRYDHNDYAHDSDLSPRFNAAWHVGETTLRAAWGIYAQAQGLHNLAVRDGDTRFYPAERAEHRILSVERKIGAGINVRLEGYERLVRNPRPHWDNVVDTGTALPELNDDRLRLAPAHQDARGVELIMEQRTNRKFSWSASYAYARAEETFPDGTTAARARDQRHTLYVDATYTPSPAWQFSFAWQYHTGWPTTDLNFFLAPLAGGGATVLSRLGPIYATPLPDYYRLDLRAQRRFQLKDSTLRVYLDVFNVFDRKNTISYRYSVNVGPGGQLSVQRYHGNSLFPLLPSIGVTWDF